MFSMETGCPPQELQVTVISMKGMLSRGRSRKVLFSLSRSMLPLKGWSMSPVSKAASILQLTGLALCRRRCALVVSKWQLPKVYQRCSLRIGPNHRKQDRLARDDVTLLQHGREEGVLRSSSLVCGEDIAIAQDVLDSRPQKLEGNRAGVALVGLDHLRPLQVTHRISTCQDKTHPSV